MSINFYVYEFLCLWIAMSMNCYAMNHYVYELICLWIVITMNCYVYELLCLWISMSMNCYVYELLCLWITMPWFAISMNCYVYELQYLCGIPYFIENKQNFSKKMCLNIIFSIIIFYIRREILKYTPFLKFYLLRKFKKLSVLFIHSRRKYYCYRQNTK